MAKYSVNDKCPCGSNLKYKKCCANFHKGKIASTALELMKSRYSAYVLKDVKYIINTTDVNNPDYTLDTISWAKDIEEFCINSDFKSLRILEFNDGDNISYVKFYVNLYIHGVDQSFTEKSKFVKINNKWLYVNGEFE
jgi:SEC-C motif-containing protein